jgi:transposase
MNQVVSPAGQVSPSEAVYAGIDVAKNKLDLARSNTPQILTLANDAEGIKQICRELLAAQPAVIVVEATGGLERALLSALIDAGLPAALVNPGRVRHFAQAMGILAKTDAIDAQVLVEFAKQTSPRLSEKRDKTRVELDALVGCRRQLLHVRTEQTNRRGTTTSTTALRAIDAVLKTVDAQIQRLDQQIARLVEGDDDLYRQDKILRQVPGVGPVLSTTMLAELPELGKLDRRPLSTLVGVAPLNNDSGKHRGKRFIRGGRTNVRCALYMATLAAIRFNDVIKNFAHRLRLNGKTGKVLIVACMRKLLCLLNAMVRDNLNWEQLHVVKQLHAASGRLSHAS